MVRTLLEWAVTKMAPPRVIYDCAGTSKYLSRWYVFGSGEGVERTGPLAIYIHKFHRGDDDKELHNHPWRWSVSLILAGGYREERRFSMFDRHWVHIRTVLPWTLNLIRGDDYHRVDLIEHDAWSLFFAGPRLGVDWGFWNRHSGETTPWREFIARKRGQAVNELQQS